MNIETIRVVSPESSENPLGFIIINRADFDSAKHEPFGDDLGTVSLAERVPTMAELLAARDQLLERERELAAEKDRIAEQAQANEVEAQRLRDEAASLQAAKDAVAAQAQAAAATAVAEKPAKAAKA
ncbi:hypothetical protein D9M09_14695 [Janthinobacterium agaricidamnosum]|uniref:Uncharacterized protein n=1 Tax=Janthinobacterium agaricidamnosum TaxID=55508 RepID=A0A3G2E990_9BURK|nr:hypothetical protein [Janthinobacterium agaricidamnosum]AYM76908.1 hypothetical protein D9M09_14695 [Janthinobacterium agaricidamnosum]